MKETDKATRPRTFNERQAAEDLGIDRLQLYLLAAALRAGRYSPLTHLLVFSDAEVEAMAAQLGVRRRGQKPWTEAQLKSIPEPRGE